MKKSLLTMFILLVVPLSSLMGNVVYTLDFTGNPDGDALSWFKKNDFKLQNDADKLVCEFKDGALIIGTDKGINGIFSKKISIKNASRIRIEWGVNQYAAGANWEKSIFRESIGVIVAFGDKKIDSGAFYVPNVPYFIGLFLGEHEVENKPYTGNFFKEGGRYFCQPCQVAPKTTVITEFNLNNAFREQFGESTVPPISGISIEADTRDTAGKSRAFIKKIELLSD